MCGSCAVYAPVVCTCHVALRLRLVQAQQLGEPLGVDLLVVRRHSPDVVLHDAELQVRFPPARLDERAWVYASVCARVSGVYACVHACVDACVCV